MVVSSITINSNIAAFNAQRRLGQSTRSLQDSFSRLSSGLRVNRAADDAAGLAIAESLKTDNRVFRQGVRNLNDGVSLLSIADAALNELSTITIRLNELAEQAANGALGNVQRKALNEEAQALRDEYFRITKTTEFNGVALFDGDFGSLRLQAGFGESGGIASTLGGAIGTGDFLDPQDYTFTASTSDVISRDFNGDGHLDLAATNSVIDGISIHFGDGTGEFSHFADFDVGDSSADLESGDFNNDGIADIATHYGPGNYLNISLGNGDGTFRAALSQATTASEFAIITGDFNADGKLDIASLDEVLLGAGDGTFYASHLFSEGNPTDLELVTADFNNDGVLDIITSEAIVGTQTLFLGNGDGSMKAGITFGVSSLITDFSVADLNNDGSLDLVLGADGVGFYVYHGNSDGTFSLALSSNLQGISTTTLADVNGDGALDIFSGTRIDGGATGVILGNSDGSFKAYNELTNSSDGYEVRGILAGDFNEDGVYDFFAEAGGGSTLFLGEATEGVSPLLAFSLETQLDARDALPLLQRKLDQIASQRGQVGAFEARISTAISTAQVAAENYTSAASQIIDADVAEESARLVRSQILQQAGAAILAQANQSPALALRLLGS